MNSGIFGFPNTEVRPVYTGLGDSIFDGFESYDTGESNIRKGFGWLYSAVVILVDYFWAFDSFESYSLGSITSVDKGTSWVAAGSFTLYDYGWGYDDLESYALGAITTVNGGTNWGADGSFTTY